MTEQQERVNRLIARLERHQAALGMADNDTKFVGRYTRHLGSTRQWRHRLIPRSWAELGQNLDKWEKKLLAFVSEIDGTSDISEFFESLPIAKYGEAIFNTLEGQKSDRRVAWLIGPTGVGKSWTMLRLARENPSAAAYMHINRGGRESLMELSRAMAAAVGAPVANGGAATFANVVEALKANPITLIIDDVHEGGVLMLKLVKHLVDDTRSKFILGTYPTAWKLLLNGSTEAHIEAQQLLGRSIKPIERRWESGLTPADTTEFLRAVLSGQKAECRVAAERITSTLNKHGNLRVLADAVELARCNSDDSGDDLTPALIEAAVREICPSEKR